MVKVRESLPLLDGMNNNADSTTMIANITGQRHSVSDLVLPKSSHQVIDENAIDIDAWIATIAKRNQLTDLPKLKKACAILKLQDLSSPSARSNAFLTGVGMTDILAYLYQDEATLVASMLYRATRKNVLTEKQVRAEFGNEVADLVNETLKMGRLSDLIENNKRLEDHFNNNQREQLAGIYSMLISMTNDVRVVLIKLAERTFAMRELSFATPERQQRVAREVMTIYAPLAHRLGIAQLKWELEDLSFSYLAPERYKEIAKLLNEKRSEREAYIERVAGQLRQALAEHGITGEITGRVKHIYSIYRKMKLKSLSFDQLYDIRALRVLVNTNAECYHVMGLVHGLWRHIPDQFDDYITNPKANGYRSLHTAVIAENKSLEVQIRTFDMHYEAELGMCAHVNYKEGTQNKQDEYLNKKISSLRQILLNQDNNNVESVKNDPLKTVLNQQKQTEEDELDFSEFERIYVFSKDGDIVELPKGASVLDFAYYVHTEVGNRTQGARVNQRYVPLTYQLKTGEQVEIITKHSREPNRDWLIASLGYINTSRARGKLRQWFNRQDRDKNIETGRHILTKELGRIGIHPNSIDLNDYIKFFNTQNADDILVGLVNGNVELHDLTGHISRHLDLEPDVVESELVPSIHPKATGKLDAYKIQVDGLDNIDIKLAGCCNPVQGEAIAGFITQSNGVSIHHVDCPEYERLVQKDADRAISAVWYGNKGKSQLVQIYIEAYDRRGLLRDLTLIIDQENANIRRVDTLSDIDDIARMNFSVEVTGLSQLSKLLAKLEQQHGIILARRVVTGQDK